MCFFSFVTRFLIIVFGILMPARHTHNALGEDQVTAWAKYWIVYGWLVCVELMGDAFFNWLPLYVESKLLIVLWLVISAPKASVWVFDVILNPLLGRFMPNIDHFLLYGKRHLVNDALNYSSEIVARSMDTLVPAVSQIWKKPRQANAIDTNVTLNIATEVSSPPFQEDESLSNPQRYMYDDPSVEDMARIGSASFTHINTLETEQPQLSKLSLPELATRGIDKGNRPSSSRLKRKQFIYNSQTSLNTDPLSGMEDLLRSERIAVEMHHHPLPPRKELRRRYQ